MHYSQQNAEKTDFPDGHFDLVVSHILAHETAAHAWPAILAESRRLLAPGGIAVHVDLPQLDEVDPYRRFIYTNETHFNNEPFWTPYRLMDLPALMRAAGFAEGEVFRDFTAVLAGAGPAEGARRGRTLAPARAWRAAGFRARLRAAGRHARTRRRRSRGGRMSAAPPRRPRIRARRAGRGPEFFDDGSSDTLLAMNVALLTELMVTRERLDTLERLVEAKGLVPRAAIDAFEPDEAAEAEREQIRETMSRHVFYLQLQQAERAERKPVADEAAAGDDEAPPG